MTAELIELETALKKQRQRSQMDHISALPDEVLLYILALLDDTRAAVQTSALSKRWQNLWRSLSDFHFDVRTVRRFSDKIRDARTARASMVKRSERGAMGLFIPSINRFLQHRRPSRVRQLHITFYMTKSCAHTIDRWVAIAVNRDIEDLSICVNWPIPSVKGDLYKFPWWVLHNRRESTSLKELELCRCALRPPADYNGFACLSKLSLRMVHVTEELMAIIFNKCERLKSLAIVQCTGMFILSITQNSKLKDVIVHSCNSIEILEITSPTLERLHYVGNRIVMTVHSAPRLEHFWLDLVNEGSGPVDYLLSDVPRELPDLKNLAFRCCRPERPTIPYSSYVPYNCLKNLSIVIDTKRLNDLLLLGWLFLRACPFLETLHTDVHMCTKSGNGSGRLIQAPFDLQHDYLKEVKMNGFQGRAVETVFVRFLLEKAAVLQSITLTCDHVYQQTGWTWRNSKSLNPLNKKERLSYLLRLKEGTSSNARIKWCS